MIKFLPPFDSSLQNEIAQVVDQTIDGSLPCQNRYVETDGDIRYWGVRESSSEFLSQFARLAQEQYSTVSSGTDPTIILMINFITAQDCPTGSGGGWHVDSVRNHSEFSYFCIGK